MEGWAQLCVAVRTPQFWDKDFAFPNSTPTFFPLELPDWRGVNVHPWYRGMCREGIRGDGKEEPSPWPKSGGDYPKGKKKKA